MRVVSPADTPHEVCGGINDGIVWRSYTPAKTLVIVYAAMGERTMFDFRANWTHGVEYDIAYGNLRAYRGGQADAGIVDVSVYAPAAPAVWAAVGTRHTIHTQGDAIGYFTPEHWGTGGETEWECRQNGAPCHLDEPFRNIYSLASREPTDWQISLNKGARISNSAYYYLSVIEFLDNTWID